MDADQGTVRGRIATAMFIGCRNLTRERRRWFLSASALAVAAMIVLFLEGISRWLTVSSTAYLDHSGAQIVVSEKGIEDLLFAQSAFPPQALAQVRALPGVHAVGEIVAVNGIVAAGHTHLPAYLVGFHAGDGGGPWQMASGSAQPIGAEVVVDRGFASIAGIGVGDHVSLFGHQLRVVGISSGTNAAGDFFLFTPIDFAKAVAGTSTVSYGLVHLAPNVSSARVTAAIDRIPGLEALQRATIANNDSATIISSFGQPVQILVVVALVAGVLIAGIVLYTATVEHTRDYAVLKALGAGRVVLYGSALLQSLVLSVCGVVLGWALAAALTVALDTWYPVIQSNLDLDLVATLAGVIVVVNFLAGLRPVRHVRRIDPQEVFKGMSTLEARNASKVFGSGPSAVEAVSDASVSVDAGEVVLLLGPSGSGKTTVVSIIGGLLTPTGRTVLIDGIGDLGRAKDRAAVRLRTIGFVFQSFNLLPSLTAVENVALPLRLLGVGRHAARERADDLLDALGLSNRRSAAPGTMSGGEKQRVSLARALVARPQVLLADEPTASLDTQTGRAAMELLRSSVREGGLACMVVTHDTRLVDLADRVMHIEDGRIVDG